MWRTPAGLLELRVRQEKVRGLLVKPSAGVLLAPGTEVLSGTFHEDSVAAEVRLGVVAPDCGAREGHAFSLLLLTRSGKLVGGVSSREPCAAEVRAAAFEYVGPTAAAARTMAGPPPPPGSYDPRGRPGGSDGPAAVLMRDAENYLHEGQFEAARRQFLEAVKKEPALGEAYNGVGVTHYARNEYAEAIEWYKRGLEAAPGFGDLYYNLACAYALLGRNEMALRYLRLAALRGYTEAEALDRDTDLSALRGTPGFAEIRALFPSGAPAKADAPRPMTGELGPAAAESAP